MKHATALTVLMIVAIVPIAAMIGTNPVAADNIHRSAIVKRQNICENATDHNSYGREFSR